MTMDKTYKRGDLFAILDQNSGKIVLDYLVTHTYPDKSFRALSPDALDGFCAFNNVGECRAGLLLALLDDDPRVVAERQGREILRLRGRLVEWLNNVTLDDLRDVCSYLKMEVR